MNKQEGTKKCKELTFVDNTTESHYVDDDIATRICIPNDAAFNGVSLTAEVSMDGKEWSAHYDRLGGTLAIAVGAGRGVVFDLNEFADMAYIRFKAADNSLNGKKITLVHREI